VRGRRGPGVKRGQVVAEPVSTMDVAATVCEAGGARLPEDAQSRSLLPLLAGKAQARDAAYSEWHVHPSRCGVGLQLRTVRTRTHKCTFELGSGAGELYDLVNDPDEMNNRFDDPAFARVRRELEDLMRARPGRVRDDLAEPIGMA
jgi:arylsulfatase A-like enzyme